MFRRGAGESGAAPISAPRMGYPLLAPSVTPLSSATVYRCVNLLADSVANLPLQYMRRRGDIFEAETSGRLNHLLSVQPNQSMNAVDFWRLAVQQILLRGNAYIIPVYDYAAMEISCLVLADPSAVAHDTVNGTYTVSDTAAGVSGVYKENEVIHLKNYTRDGKRGLSVLGFARVTLDIAAEGDRETLERFRNGGNVRGIINNDTGVRGFGEYQDAELNKAAADIDGKFRSGSRIVSVPGSAQFSPLSLSSADMQFLESRKFTVRDICRFFGVHPSFVFDDTSNNYKSAEMANVAFLSNTLNPLLRRIEVELLCKLVPPSLSGKRKFLFDRSGLYACDLDSRVRFQTQTIAAGLYTVNEWRRIDNKPPVAGGDTVMVSANLKSINGEPNNEPNEE